MFSPLGVMMKLPQKPSNLKMWFKPLEAQDIPDNKIIISYPRLIQIINQHIRAHPNHLEVCLTGKTGFSTVKEGLKGKLATTFTRYAFCLKRVSTRPDAVETTKNRGLGTSSVEA